MRKIMTFAMLSGALLVTACNTISGAGKDVASVGDTVSDTAEGAK